MTLVSTTTDLNETLGALQDSPAGAAAVRRLLLAAAADLEANPGDHCAWNPRVRALMDAFVLVFDLDDDDLAAWVTDIASDEVTEREHGKTFLLDSGPLAGRLAPAV